MFIKFPKITNVGMTDPFDGRYINHQGSWYVTEKIDGSNCSIIIDRDRNVTFAGRTHVIDDSYDIFGLREQSKHYQDLVDSIIEIVNTHNIDSINVYGEYYGLGIQKRIFYGRDKMIRIYGALINDSHWLTFPEFLEMFSTVDRKWIIPVLGVFDDWDHAVDYANNYGITNNKVSVLSENDCGEGVVLYPGFTLDNSEFVAYKVKTDKFKENNVRSRDVANAISRIDNPNQTAVQKAKSIVKDMINDNRVYSLISKIGIPSDNANTGKILKMLIDDALEDAKSSYPQLFEQLSDDDIRSVVNLRSYPYIVYTTALAKIKSN